MTQGILRATLTCTAAVWWRLHTRGLLVAADHDPIAGYTPVSDVLEHSQIDLDMVELEAGADLETDAGFAAAWDAYNNGGNRCDIHALGGLP